VTMPLLMALLLAAQSAGTGGGISNVATNQERPQAPAAPRLASINFVRVVYDEQGRTPAVGNYSRGKDFTAYIHTVETICAAGRDSRTPPMEAAFGWEITGKFLSRTPAEVIVQLDWRRAWEQGRPVNAPSGSVNLALHPGERVSLDRITTTAVPGKCRGVGMTLSVEFSNGTSMVGAGVSAGGSPESGVGRVGSATVNSGLAKPVDRAAEFGAYMEEWRARGQADGPRSSARLATEGMSASVVSDFDPRTLQTTTAELWLVHRLPSGVEESEFRSVQTTPGDGAFEFAPVSISVGAGAYAIAVKGFVQAQRLADGTENLDVGLLRSVTLVGPAPKVITAGAAGRKFATPQAGEVISLELPPGGTPPLGGHQFSVRVRVKR